MQKRKGKVNKASLKTKKNVTSRNQKKKSKAFNNACADAAAFVAAAAAAPEVGSGGHG
jgi:hypothetical protein